MKQAAVQTDRQPTFDGCGYARIVAFRRDAGPCPRGQIWFL